MFRILFICFLPLAISNLAKAQSVATFEGLPYQTSPPLLYENGVNLSGSFTSGGSIFNNSYQDYGVFKAWSGWSYSSVMNTTTPGFDNQYAAYATSTNGAGPPTNPGDTSSSSYAVAFAYMPGIATIELADGQRPMSMMITNTTYTYFNIRDGDPEFGTRPFEEGDYFLLTISGYNSVGQSTGTLNFYLADYRDGKHDIVDDWTSIDLSSFAIDTKTLSFGFTTTVFDENGDLTPTYFAMDNFTTSAVPEPATVGLLAVGGLGLYRVTRRRFYST